MATRTLTLLNDAREHQVEVLDAERVRVDDRVYGVRREENDTFRVEGDTTKMVWSAIVGDVWWVFVDGHVYQLTEPRRLTKVRRPGSSHPGSLAAPMPATVRRVLVKSGASVKPGDALLILEAMKMELPVRATSAGTVTAVKCVEGELVQPGVPLIELVEDEIP
jgi:biotin carboxyl carrier protein